VAVRGFSFYVNIPFVANIPLSLHADSLPSVQRLGLQTGYREKDNVDLVAMKQSRIQTAPNFFVNVIDMTVVLARYYSKSLLIAHLSTEVASCKI
jgi:hypothetical protein